MSSIAVSGWSAPQPAIASVCFQNISDSVSTTCAEPGIYYIVNTTVRNKTSIEASKYYNIT